MKRFLIALIVFAVIIGICVAEHFVVNGFLEEIEMSSAEIYNSRISLNKAAEKDSINKLKKYIEDEEILINIFCHEQIFDDIERTVCRMESLSRYEDNALFFSELETLKSELGELKRSTGFSLRGIF